MRCGNQIRAKRKAKGLTQAALAQLVGVGSGVISQYERNDIQPSGTRLLALARVLDTTAEELAAEAQDDTDSRAA
jgi:transcriptional regulator with XRE-family HTH domain